MLGNLVAINLVLSTKEAVIVLSNFFVLNNTIDWLRQIYFEVYLGIENKNNYIALSKESAQPILRWHLKLIFDLFQNQNPGTHHKNLSKYSHIYHNVFQTMMIQIFIDSSSNETLLKLIF